MTQVEIIEGDLTQCKTKVSIVSVCFQYLSLLRGIASSLEMENISGMQSMAHIPDDERVRLGHDRERAVEVVTSKIKVLKERIGRKDELLQGYDTDLAKLR